MSYECIEVSTSDRITTIAFNRPDKMNAISPQMLDELNAAVAWCGTNADTGVVILTGKGRAFSAGVDLISIGERKPQAGAVGSVLDDPARRLIASFGELPKVVIAKINGFCFTGALEIALGCDLIYIAEEAKLGDTHVKWGLRPTWGMSQRLPRTIGYMRARELSFTARTFTGRDAAEWGLANAAVPAAALDATVDAVAKEILANSLDAIAAVKDLYNKGKSQTLADGLQTEFTSKYTIRDTADRVAGFAKK